MIKLIQKVYTPRDITNFKTATMALKLLTSQNDCITKITQLVTKRT